MACGDCNCGHKHPEHGAASVPGAAGKSTRGNFVLTGVAAALLGVIGLVTAAVALQPGKPATPDKPATPTPAAEPEKNPDNKDLPASSAAAPSPYVLGYTMKRLDGTEESLEKHKGSVVLIVNVASRCGLTKQYTQLQELYQKNKDRGLIILGFPANDFNGQEPGTNKEIAEFCSSKYQVTFPMFEKISVKGPEAHALYKQLAAQPAPIGGEPKWNFHKFVVDRSGNVVAKFDPKVKPDDAELVKKIDELLSAK